MRKTFIINRQAFFSLVGLFVFSMVGLSATPAAAEGRLYVPDEASAHCTVWDNLRLTWPQTVLGRETAKCRRGLFPLPRLPVIAACDVNISIPKQARACVFT